MQLRAPHDVISHFGHVLQPLVILLVLIGISQYAHASQSDTERKPTNGHRPAENSGIENTASPALRSSDARQILEAARAAQAAAEAARRIACHTLGRDACARLQAHSRASDSAAPSLADNADRPLRVQTVGDTAGTPSDAAPKPPAKKPAGWELEGTAGISFISSTGNANAVSAKANTELQTQYNGWTGSLQANIAYGQTRVDATTSEVTAQRGKLELSTQRRFGRHLYVYGGFGGNLDRVASINYQLFGEPGVGIVWFENRQARATGEKTYVASRLETQVGFRYTHENRFQFFPTRQELPNEEIYAISISGSFVYALSRGTAFKQSVSIKPDVVSRENLRVNSSSILTARLVEPVALQVQFDLRYIGEPAAGKAPLDTMLSAGLSTRF